MDKIKIIKELVMLDPTLVVVGSIASILNGVYTDKKKNIEDCIDIDIIVPETKWLEKVYDLNFYTGKGYYADTTKRASMTLYSCFIDIFIHDTKSIPTRWSEELNANIVTLEGQVNFYQRAMRMNHPMAKGFVAEVYNNHNRVLNKRIN